MEGKICNLIQDLIPLYVDGVVSPETTSTVKKHLETCSSCRKEYERLSGTLIFPVSPSMSKENAHSLVSFKRRWRQKKIIVVCISVVMTLLILFMSVMVYQNVSTVHDFFSPTIYASLRTEVPSDQWQRLFFGFDKRDTLIFDSIFFSRKITCDANSTAPATLRFLDADGNIVLDGLEVTPGISYFLDELSLNIPYIVEIKTDADFILLNFH